MQVASFEGRHGGRLPKCFGSAYVGGSTAVLVVVHVVSGFADMLCLGNTAAQLLDMPRVLSPYRKFASSFCS